jgi:hypothetical protein
MSGLHTTLFNERLMASMAIDRRNKAQHLGRNRDTSDDLWDGRMELIPPNATYTNLARTTVQVG